jgi:hypothetical protein
MSINWCGRKIGKIMFKWIGRMMIVIKMRLKFVDKFAFPSRHILPGAKRWKSKNKGKWRGKEKGGRRRGIEME